MLKWLLKHLPRVTIKRTYMITVPKEEWLSDPEEPYTYLTDEEREAAIKSFIESGLDITFKMEE